MRGQPSTFNTNLVGPKLDQGQRSSQYAPTFTAVRRQGDERVPVHGIFLTKPKIKIIVNRPRILPDGYPIHPRTIGEKLKKQRLDKGLFQKDVAKILGVDVNTITNWEKGRNKPGGKNLGRVAEFLTHIYE